MRIAIVNDVKIVVEALKRIVSKQTDHHICWVAYDGADAVAKCQVEVPDLILMDLVMPVMNGVQATKKIMESTPCPILVVTSSVSGHSTLVFEAMGMGALDVVRTPELTPKGTMCDVEPFLKKIEVIGKLTGKIGKQTPPSSPSMADLDHIHKLPALLVIGASTGGPMALAKVLAVIPQKTELAIVVIQHVDEYFADGLAGWLSEQTQLPVKISEDGEMVRSGVILMAGRNQHLVLTKNYCLRYVTPNEENVYCPSVDVFFNSLASYWPSSGIAVLLTGMGNDGARGLKLLHDKGWFTIAEHQSSCVVYGMPKAAIDMGAATEIIPLEQIGNTIMNVLPILAESKK